MHHAKCILTLILLLLNVAAFGQAGANKFRFRGILYQEGIPVANSTVDFRFRIFDVATGGSQIGSEVLVPGVPISSGEYSVLLDLSQGPYVSGQTYWAEAAVRFAGAALFTTLSPRKLFTIGTSRGLKMFNEPGTNYFVVPAGVHQILVEAWGGGGGGANSGGQRYRDIGDEDPLVEVLNYGGPGGGGGGYAKGMIPVIPGTTNAIVVGAGGLGGAVPTYTTNVIDMHVVVVTNFVLLTNGLKGGDTVVFGLGTNRLLTVTGGGGATNMVDPESGEPSLRGSGAGGLGDTNFTIYHHGERGSGGVIFSAYYLSSHTHSQVGGSGGRTPIGSAQPGGMVQKCIAGHSQHTGVLEYTVSDSNWIEEPMTYGGGGAGGSQGGIGFTDLTPGPSPGIHGCVILKW